MNRGSRTLPGFEDITAVRGHYRALTELGWINDLKRCLDIVETADYPDPLMDLLMQKSGASGPGEVRTMVEPQREPLASRLRQTIAQEEEEKRLREEEEQRIREEEDEREHERLRELERQRRLEAMRRMRSYCPICGLSNCGWTNLRVTEFV